MGTYTILDDKKIDETIARDLSYIVKKVTEVSSAYEIILGGGFGRGEGSVLVDNDKIQPVNDYDIFVIVKDDDVTDFRTLGKSLAKEIQIRMIDLIPVKYSFLSSLPPTQYYYDLKRGGLHLWGENLFCSMPDYEEGYIAYEGGRTLLLNRLICALEAFSEDFESRDMTPEERFFLVNQTGKIVSSCVEALLIKRKKYHHSLRKRQEIFEKEFSGRKTLKKLNKKATEFKLKPTFSSEFDAINYWKEAIHEYISVISIYLAPGFTPPAYRLWKKLNKKKNKTSIANVPIERVELLLLIYREASSFNKVNILSMAHNELETLLNDSVNIKEWEALRKITTQLWHKLY